MTFAATLGWARGPTGVLPFERVQRAKDRFDVEFLRFRVLLAGSALSLDMKADALVTLEFSDDCREVLSILNCPILNSAARRRFD